MEYILTQYALIIFLANFVNATNSRVIFGGIEYQWYYGYSMKKYQRKDRTYGFTTIPDIPLSICALECFHTRQCDAIEYTPRLNLCVILRNGVISGRIPSPGIVLGIKIINIPISLSNLLGNDTNTACGPLFGQGLRGFNGNMFGIGNKLRYVCRFQAGIHTAECTEEGKWTELVCTT